MIPIDDHGFFCTSRRALEDSTEEADFKLSPAGNQSRLSDRIRSSTSKFDPRADVRTSNSKDSVVITPEQKAEDSKKQKTLLTRAETKSWVRAILEAEPCIVTQKGLYLALQHNAPVQVIRFMLTINPDIMNFPKVGPTPLQVAVRHNANLDVVQMLLEASPFGLCITNDDYPERPLEYAKRCHSNRTGLIDLLSRPLNYWIKERKIKIRDINRKRQQRGNHGLSSYPKPNDSLQQLTKERVGLLSPPPFSARRSRAHSLFSPSSASEPLPSPKKDVLTEVKFPLNTTDNQQFRSEPHLPVKLPESVDMNRIDREEINNVKALCAHLYKAHRKMANEVITCKENIESHSKLFATMGTKNEIVEELMKEQRSQMFRNWIALDIKERAYQSRLEKMEQQYVQQLEKRLDSWTGSMRLWNESTREQLQELQEYVESEAEINERFRNNMTDWIEKYQLDQDNYSGVPSHIFATNLGEVDEKVPLCGAIRGRFCGYRTNSTDNDTDPIMGVDENVSPLKRVKKRSWRPIFRNRDRIPLSDEK